MFSVTVFSPVKRSHVVTVLNKSKKENYSIHRVPNEPTLQAASGTTHQN